MNTTKRLTLLSIITAAIILLWLVPGINTARDTTYTRFYEDTDHLSLVKTGNDPIDRKKKSARAARKKIYKKESIRSGVRLKDVKPQMFSRAIQFSEQKVPRDTAFAKIVAVDSAAVQHQ